MQAESIKIRGELSSEDTELVLDLIGDLEELIKLHSPPSHLGPLWIIVVGLGTNDVGPVCVRRYGGQPTFTGSDVRAVVSKMNRWLDEKRSLLDA